MKYFITIFFLFISSTVFSETYYCAFDNYIGFDQSDNNEIKEFKLRKFIIDIDIENQIVVTDENTDDVFIGYADFVPKSCVTMDGSEIYCISSLGVAFSFNKVNQIFKFARILNMEPWLDDITLGYGKCSKF